MQEIKYLTEKDMEYFYKLEEQGEVVIIRLEPEQLLSLDFSELDGRKTNADSEISEEEVRQWLQQCSSELHKKYEKNESILRENQKIRSILDNGDEFHGSNDTVQKNTLHSVNVGKKNREALIKFLKEAKLDDEQVKTINTAIHHGIDDEVLLVMLRSELNAEKMQKICDELVSIMN